MQMGAVSLKTQRELSKKGIPGPKQARPLRPAAPIPSAPSAAAAAEALANDSFSETRAMSPLYSDQEDSDVEQENPFPEQAKDPWRAIQPIIDARQKAEICEHCTIGFQPRRKIHLVCQKCSKWHHKRCLTRVAKARDPYFCLTCVPDTILDPDLGEQSVLI